MTAPTDGPGPRRLRVAFAMRSDDLLSQLLPPAVRAQLDRVADEIGRAHV